MKKKIILLNDKTLSVLSANLVTSVDSFYWIDTSVKKKMPKKWLKDAIVLNGNNHYFIQKLAFSYNMKFVFLKNGIVKYKLILYRIFKGILFKILFKANTILGKQRFIFQNLIQWNPITGIVCKKLSASTSLTKFYYFLSRPDSPNTLLIKTFCIYILILI